MSPEILRHAESKFLVINFFFTYKFLCTNTKLVGTQSLLYLLVCVLQIYSPYTSKIWGSYWVKCFYILCRAIHRLKRLFPNSAIIHMMKYIFLFVSINCMVYFLEMYHRYIERIQAKIMDGNTFCLYHWNRGKIKLYLRKCTAGIAIIVHSIFACWENEEWFLNLSEDIN